MRDALLKRFPLIVIVIVLIAIQEVEGQAPRQKTENRALLVSLGQPSRPWFFVGQNHIPHIDSLPFSGMTFNLPATFTLMHSVQYGPWTEQDIRDQFGGLNFSFQNLTKNMASVVIRRNGVAHGEGDFFDDEAWATTVEQFARLARVARDPKYQCIGICFDNEEYFEGVWNYPDDVAHADVHSLQAYSEKARQRGREVMQAIQSAWPEAVVLVLHGPYRSTPENRPFEVSMNQVGGAEFYELDAPFFFGMAEVAADKKVFDGGEVYQLRSKRQFNINRRWRRFELKNSAIVPPELREVYTQRVGLTHGLYNLPWPTPNDVMNPAVMKQTLRNAFQSGEDHVWIFIESNDTWLIPGGFPKDWRRKIEEANNFRPRIRSSAAER